MHKHQRASCLSYAGSHARAGVIPAVLPVPPYLWLNCFTLSYAVQIARDKLVALGTSIGKFTHSGKFRLTVGALDVLAQYAKYKVGRLHGNIADTKALLPALS